MPKESPFAYSLSQEEEGWRWSVYDQDGVTVAAGADPGVRLKRARLLASGKT
jgi:hypothetical protein